MSEATLNYLKEVIGHIAEDIHRAGELAADEDDDELNRRIYWLELAVMRAGSRIVDLETNHG